MDWQEFWLPIVGYANYEISNYGDVRNAITGFILNGELNFGYHRVQLYNSIGRRKFRVHKLMMLTFASKSPGRNEINHIDGCKNNNIATNLEWCTSKENKEHAIKYGLITPNMMGKEFVPVRQLTKDGIFIQEFDSLKQADSATHANRNNITKVCKGERKYAGGYRWEIADRASRPLMKHSKGKPAQ